MTKNLYTGQFTDTIDGDNELFQITPVNLEHIEEAGDPVDAFGNELEVWIKVDDEFRPAAYRAALEAEGWTVIEAATEATGAWTLAR